MEKPKKSVRLKPKYGERVLLCPHAGDERRMFWFLRTRKKEVVDFTRSDGTKGLASWFCLCEECKLLYKENPRKILNFGEISWGEDFDLVEARIQ